MTYHLVGVLGQGSSARVYEAYREDLDSGLRQRVALKFLHSKNEVEKLRQEFGSLSRVQSPHCIRLLSFEYLKGHPALVLEFVDGVTLSQLIQCCHLSREVVNEVLAQIQKGLRDLRQVSLCHGDLSADNVLVDTQGHVKLIDFGMANFSGRNRQVTPMFAAPEVLQGGVVSWAADLFSLGILEGLMLRKWSLEGLCHWNPNHYSQSGHNFLDPESQNRTWRHIEGSEKQQMELAQKVGTVKDHLSRANQHTLVCPADGKDLPVKFTDILSAGLCYLKGQRALASVVVLLLTLLAFSGSSPESSALVQAQAPAYIKIRSHNWLWYSLQPIKEGRNPSTSGVQGKLRVADSLEGYSPMDSTAIVPGVYQLRYKTAKGQGSLSLTILPGENKVLQGSDLMRE